MSDETKWATSKKLRINLPENMFVLTGDPRVVQNNDEILGDEIVFLEGGKKVQVNSGTATLSDKMMEATL